MKPTLLFTFFLFTTVINAQWVQKGSDIDGDSTLDFLGRALSMPDANTLAVGAPQNDDNGVDAGHVRIYRWTGSAWIQKGLDIRGEAAGDQSGYSLSMPDSNTIAIGARLNDGNGSNSGHVRIFKWNGTAWLQKGFDIDGESTNSTSGGSVSMPDSNTVAIGGPGNDIKGTLTGHARIYRWNGSAWIQKGLDIDGDAAFDTFGSSICMPDSSLVAIGGRGHDGNGSSSGIVRVFEWSGNAWTQKGLDILGDSANDFLGTLSMPDTNTIAVGAYKNNAGGSEAGLSRVLDWSGTTWVQRGQDIYGVAVGDHSGISLSMPSDNILAIGSNLNDGNGTDAGHVRIFEWINNSWLQKGSDIDGELAGDWSGWAISMADANVIAIGAYKNDANGPSSGHTRVFRNGINTSLVKSKNLKALNIYPNPTRDDFFLERNSLKEDDDLIIYNMQGKIILRKMLDERNEKIETDNWNQGIYFVKYGDTIKKLVITK